LLSLCAALAALPLTAQELQQAPAIDGSALTLDAASQPVRSGPTKTYVVRMAHQPAASYDGSLTGYAATAPEKGKRYNGRSARVQKYSGMLTREHDKALKSVGANGRKIYSYTHAMNGFAARLTDAEAAALRSKKNVVSVWEDYAIDIDTSETSEFLGLTDSQEGLRNRFGLKGENVIVGILDTGAVQEHPSFSDNRLHELPAYCEDPQGKPQANECNRLRRELSKTVYGPPPAGWNGICQIGEAWSEADCNNKLIGARWYVDGFLAGRGSVVDGEFLSPRDSSGHGSHTASTAAGNENVPANLAGTDVGIISGMAPRARVAVYKVCWLSPGASNFSCFFSDSAAATDAAVADGVDVINFSVGTAASFTDPQDLAFLDATAAGVSVARSAGNDGPGFATTNAGEPWVTSVAASTADGEIFTLDAIINSPDSVAGAYSALEGAITGPLAELGPITDDVVAAEPIEACTPLSNSIDGKIALIARGSCTFVAKVENAVAAGASAILMYTDDRPKTVMGGTATPITTSVPGVMIDREPGLAIFAELEGGATVNATLDAGALTPEPRVGNIMAGFSSRGPFRTEANWVKPDITAPGVNILAANTPDQADGSVGGLFGYLGGTSMSSPHIAGLMALVKEAQPGFSPAQVKSALMTTARQDIVKEDGATDADPFDFGAGHVDPNKAVSPGLTYDAGLLDYLAASCGTVTPLLTPDDCDFVENEFGLSTDPADLNLPSIGVDGVPGTKTVTRTVTAVKPFVGRGRYGNDGPVDDGGNNSANRYDAVIEAPPGFDVSVNPSTFTLLPGESAEFEVTITNVSAPPGEWRFGSLTWTNRKGIDVRSPIAVNAAAFVAPDEIDLTGISGSDSFDIAFGYTGDYIPQVHGLNEPTPFLAIVEDDPFDEFEFLGPGVTIAFLDEVPAGTALARWTTYNEYTSGNDDIDLYLYYCPNFSCTQIASSGNPDSDELVEVLLPVNDPNITDPYLVFAHGFDTEGGLPADVILFYNEFGLDDDAGNMTITSAPGSAVLGESGTINYEWNGLREGVGAKQLGAISHSDASGILDITIIDIQNDEGFGICDFGICEEE
jgi:hypothetical protein